MADQKNQTNTDPAPQQEASELATTLARPLRIGLLGSPYDWGSLDFDAWNNQNVHLSLTAFAGSSQAKEQDLLLLLKQDELPTDTYCILGQNEDSVLECSLGSVALGQLTPQSIYDIYSVAIQQANDRIINKLKVHDEKYLSAESIIAKYGIQVLRAGTLLNNSQIHIENEALAYLIETPWRNGAELEYVIAKMVFYLDGDILRKPYVQNYVYEFGTSLRGVSNSAVAQTLIQQFTNDVIGKFDFKVATELFAIHLESFNISMAKDLVVDEKRAA